MPGLIQNAVFRIVYIKASKHPPPFTPSFINTNCQWTVCNNWEIRPKMWSLFVWLLGTWLEGRIIWNSPQPPACVHLSFIQMIKDVSCRHLIWVHEPFQSFVTLELSACGPIFSVSGRRVRQCQQHCGQEIKKLTHICYMIPLKPFLEEQSQNPIFWSQEHSNIT